ncbi:TetR/AcrR family transcriptional regulator [Catenulispora subtropica]|uniref:TetR/AcrR family transcriptional regulator n=1 Tax=Catenulispora subtropica TaxID=450798 RepID=UPI0031D8A15E
MDTADRLIESTRELLWERGYVGTSPKAIQQRAGAGQGSMYHHFAGKPALALAAIERTAAEMTARAEAQFGGPGTAKQRLLAYLHRERDVLRGCPIGGLTQDPDIMADPRLRAPVTGTLAWLRGRIADLVAEGVASGEFAPALDPIRTATTIVAVMQGGYVLARAADDPSLFDDAIAGLLPLLGEL